MGGGHARRVPACASHWRIGSGDLSEVPGIGKAAVAKLGSSDDTEDAAVLDFSDYRITGLPLPPITFNLGDIPKNS
ncbi:hypothetical protein P3T76_002772 [Phytophthora citrophthora]|uniref:Uncharacterized protein n=1 Tax=Phytophthora citrophthora TaxID=4793 RepID=A0AAD9FXN2_9STRA|nr:hypothetical protein P3T76_016385 [Phytophthora citrophthora]KAK1945724.1 hypothetical protein P3T76_002772 [Phytophthora citrophthora]